MTEIIYILERNFENIIITPNALVVIECSINSKQNGACIIMKPLLMRVQSDLGKLVRFFRIDITKNYFIFERYFLHVLPSYLVFYEGSLLERIDGTIPYSELIEILRKHIFNQNIK